MDNFKNETMDAPYELMDDELKGILGKRYQDESHLFTPEAQARRRMAIVPKVSRRRPMVPRQTTRRLPRIPSPLRIGSLPRCTYGVIM